MNSSLPTAFLDANVLYSAPLRDLLMHLAIHGAYHPRWSCQVQDEWKRSLIRNRPELSQARLDRTAAMMNIALPDALVTGYEELVDGLQMPDADDRHVLAAAIKCNASAVVTFNLKDFPVAILEPFDVQAVHPDEFIVNLWRLAKFALI